MVNTSSVEGRTARAPRAPIVALLTVLGCLDAAFAWSRHSVWPTIVFYSVAVIAVLRPCIPERLRPTSAITSGAISLVALVITAMSGVRDWAAFGPGQVGVLLAVVLTSVRRLSPVRAVLGGTAAVLAVALLPLREGSVVDDPSIVAVTFVLIVLAGAALVLGLYLRSFDRTREDGITRMRSSERLNMAAELHDFVAHHVTGIVAQAQLGQLLVQGEPDRDRLNQTFRGIEVMAADALASMRHTVHLLRNPPAAGSGAAAPTGTDGLAAIADLVQRWDLPVAYRIDNEIGPDLPHAVQAAAFRVVREALTNVRAHAGAATHVEVVIERRDRQLRITVLDDGSHARRCAGEHPVGHGLGLIGLRERVGALGGTLTAGPPLDGGWLVQASIPIPASRNA